MTLQQLIQINEWINGRQRRKTHQHSVQVANRTIIQNGLLGLENEATVDM